MTRADTGIGTLATVLAALLAVPLFVMGVVMPLLALTGGGHVTGGPHLLMPLIPLTVLGALTYVLFVAGGDDGGAGADSPLDELEAAYARGDLSDEEFEIRRDRLRSRPNDTAGTEVSRHE